MGKTNSQLGEHGVRKYYYSQKKKKKKKEEE
jgi:hypothetical protein